MNRETDQENKGDALEGSRMQSGPPYSWMEVESFLKDLADFESGDMKMHTQLSPPNSSRSLTERLELIWQQKEPQQRETQFTFFDEMMKMRNGMSNAESPKTCAYCGKPTKVTWWFNSELMWDSLCGREGYLHYCLDCEAWYPIELSIMS